MFVFISVSFLGLCGEFSQDPAASNENQQILNKLKETYSKLQNIEVTYSQQSLTSGGFEVADPGKAKQLFRDGPMEKVIARFWPEATRIEITSFNSVNPAEPIDIHRIALKNSEFLKLDMLEKIADRKPNPNDIGYLRDISVLNGMGLRYYGLFSFDLVDFIRRSNQVDYKKVGPDLLEVLVLQFPKDVKPFQHHASLVDKAVVKIVIDTKLNAVKGWALLVPQSLFSSPESKPEARMYEKNKITFLNHPGYYIFYGFANYDFLPAEGFGIDVHFPTKVFSCGGGTTGLATVELLRKIPALAEDQFPLIAPDDFVEPGETHPESRKAKQRLAEMKKRQATETNAKIVELANDPKFLQSKGTVFENWYWPVVLLLGIPGGIIAGVWMVRKRFL